MKRMLIIVTGIVVLLIQTSIFATRLGNIDWTKPKKLTTGNYPSVAAFNDGTGRILEVHS